MTPAAAPTFDMDSDGQDARSGIWRFGAPEYYALAAMVSMAIATYIFVTGDAQSERLLTLRSASVAVLVSAAFAPWHLYPLAVLSPAVLFYLWLHAAPRRAFWYGFLYGLGMFGAGVSWLHISINLFGGVNFAGSVLLTFLFVAFIALFPAGAGYLAARVRQAGAPPVPAALASNSTIGGT